MSITWKKNVSDTSLHTACVTPVLIVRCISQMDYIVCSRSVYVKCATRNTSWQSLFVVLFVEKQKSFMLWAGYKLQSLRFWFPLRPCPGRLWIPSSGHFRCSMKHHFHQSRPKFKNDLSFVAVSCNMRSLLARSDVGPRLVFHVDVNKGVFCVSE